MMIAVIAVIATIDAIAANALQYYYCFQSIFDWKCLNVHSVRTNFCLNVHGVCTNLCLNVHSPCLLCSLFLYEKGMCKFLFLCLNVRSVIEKLQP